MHKDLRSHNRVLVVRQGAGQGGRGRLGKAVELRRPHTIHTCIVSFLLVASQEKRLQCPVKSVTLSMSFRSQLGIRPTLDASLWSSEPDRMIPFLRWQHWFSHPPGQVCSAPGTPHLHLRLGKLISFSLAIWVMGTMVPHFSENLGSVKMTGVHVWSWNSASSFLFAECMQRVVPKTLKSEEDPCRVGLWLLLKQFSLLAILLSPTLLSRTCLFPFFHGSTCLNSVSSSCLSAPWELASPLSWALRAVPGTKETVHNSLRKEGKLDGAHSSCPQ